MKKLLFRLFLYTILVLLSLEIIVRVFHLHKDTPSRFLDAYNVEKWIPRQQGITITGNRKQNAAAYHINSSGFNSYREFNPTENDYEVALVGDSFIEGFHQPFQNSIGKKIEKQCPRISVFEYGYGGYDLADQLHLMYAYKDIFDKIDHTFIYLDFYSDLTRDSYKVIPDRLALESSLNKFIKHSKLLIYISNIGMISSVRATITSFKNFITFKEKKQLDNKINDLSENDLLYLQNFKKLIEEYPLSNEKNTVLLNSEFTPVSFINYLTESKIPFLDFSAALNISEIPTTLIYDQHWNNYGRDLVARLITQNIKLKRKQ